MSGHGQGSVGAPPAVGYVRKDVRIGGWIGTKQCSASGNYFIRWLSWRREGDVGSEAARDGTVPAEVQALLDEPQERGGLTCLDVAGVAASHIVFATTYTAHMLLVSYGYFASRPDGDRSFFSDRVTYSTTSIALATVTTVLYLWCFVWYLSILLGPGPGYVPRRYCVDAPSLVEDELDGLPQCVPCVAYKPVRSHHCSKCRACILRYDHHCYFFGQCVGLHNHKQFIVVVAYAVLLCVYWVASAFPLLLALWSASPATHHLHTPAVRGTAVTSLALVGVVFIGTGTLLAQHAVLLSRNMTGVEYRRGDTAFSLGSAGANLASVFGEAQWGGVSHLLPTAPRLSHDGTSYIRRRGLVSTALSHRGYGSV